MMGPCVTYSGLTLRVSVCGVCVCARVREWSILIIFCPYLCVHTDIKGWGISPRGAGYLFGSDVVQEVTNSVYSTS